MKSGGKFKRLTIFILSCVVFDIVNASCREDAKKERTCEKLCDENGKCEIRAAVVISTNTTILASRSTVSKFVYKLITLE